MSETHGRWVDQLSDYLDDELAEDERGALEVHLAGCEVCRSVLADLRDVIKAAANLPDLEAPDEVWVGVAAGIGGDPRVPSTRGDVIEFPVRGALAGRRPASGLFLSLPQIAAAALLLIVFSGAATWFAGRGIAASGDGPSALPSTPVVMTSDVPRPPEALASELAALEEVLGAAGGILDPNTVRVLERNLAVVENAIEDSYRALALDPENEFLAEHLEQVFRRKLEYLRDAARVLEWAG